MRNDHPAREHMKQAIIVTIVCAVAVIGCTDKHTDGEKGRSVTDSVRVADSTLQLAPAQPVRKVSYEEEQGAFLYGKYCAVCHGQEGKGDGFNAFNLDPRPRDLSDSTYMRALSDDQILQTINGGGRSVNKSPLMPAYGWTLKKQQIRYVASYIRSLTGQ
jgi:mono/diheme cytochrome c family protein